MEHPALRGERTAEFHLERARRSAARAEQRVQEARHILTVRRATQEAASRRMASGEEWTNHDWVMAARPELEQNLANALHNLAEANRWVAILERRAA